MSNNRVPNDTEIGALERASRDPRLATIVRWCARLASLPPLSSLGGVARPATPLAQARGGRIDTYPVRVGDPIIIEPRMAVVRLAARGFESSKICLPTVGLDRRLGWAYAHPTRAPATAFVDAVVAGCLRPRRTVAEVAALPESDRARLRLALVRLSKSEGPWRGMYGSHLTRDERLLAVMVWSREAQHEQLTRRVAELAGRYLARNPKLANTVEKLLKPPAATDALAAFGGRHSAVAMLGPGPSLSKLFPDYSKLVPNYSTLFGDRSRLPGAASGPLLATTAMPRFRAAASLNGPRGVLDLVFGGTRGAVPPFFREPPWARTLKNALSGLEPRRLGTAHLAGASAALRNPALDMVLGLRVPSRLPFSGFDPTALERIVRPLADWGAALEEAGRFMLRWEQDALWFLLCHFGMGASRRLARLSRDGVEAALLLALEAVVGDGEYVDALRQAVERAPLLNPSQATHLDHMLEHAAAGEYVEASAPLYPGLEGAYWAAAYATTVITPERTRIDNPNKKVGFEAAVKLLALPPDHQTFMIRAVFGTTGDAYRHGAADAGERRQVLLGVAALAGWLERFAEEPALDVLGTRLAAALPAAVDRVLAAPMSSA